MLNVLVSGRLTSEPQRRTAANGNEYVTATAGVDTPGGSILVGLLAFEPASERLAQLRKGAAIAAAGEAKLTAWEKAGEQHHGLSVTVVELLTPYVARQRRKATAEREKHHASAET